MESTNPPFIITLLLAPLVGLHAAAAEVPQAYLPDTGQPHHYTRTFGEDSDFSGRGPSHAGHGDGTVTDKITGLVCHLATPPATSAAAGSAPIAWSDIGAKAGAQYHGDALNVTATGNGAHLTCGFQKMEGTVTSEGLWLPATRQQAWPR